MLLHLFVNDSFFVQLCIDYLCMEFSFYRFWVISDPVMDEEASVVQNHQRKEVHPIVNCDKASLECKVVTCDIIFHTKNLDDIVYVITGSFCSGR